VTDDLNAEHPNELAKRRRVRELTEQIADLCKDAGERFLELQDIGVDTRDIVQLVSSHFSAQVRESFEGSSQSGVAFALDSLYFGCTTPHPTNDEERRIQAKRYGAMMSKYDLGGAEGVRAVYSQAQTLIDRRTRDPSLGRTAMERVIDRLFAEAPKLEGSNGKPVDGQAPALECFIVLRTGPTISGVLSQTPEGLLRMLSPTEITDPKTKRLRTVFAEQFFHVSDVLTVVLQREVTGSMGSQIVSS
jgi:hypothetical protein